MIAGVLDVPASGDDDEALSRSPAVAAPAGFTQIGVGLPLTILISHVYTGRYPKESFIGSSKKDMLLVSACKDHSVFNATPRAVNYIKRGIKARSQVKGPAATEEGTRVVLYSPAVTTDALVVSFEMVFDTFPAELITKIGNAFGTAAGIPLFMPAAGYLLTGGSILRLAASLGEALFDGEPVFSVTDVLEFDTPGMPAPQADFRILANPGFDPTTLRYDPAVGLVSARTGRLYDGDQPCVVVSLDGAVKPKLESFAPTLASAAVLNRFYGVKSSSDAAIDGFIEAMKIVNDVKFRNEADKTAASLAKLDKGSEEYKVLEKQFKAFVKNIGDDRLRPSLP